MTAANPSSPTLRSSLSAGLGLRSHLSVADGNGNFRLRVPKGSVRLKVSGKYMAAQEKDLSASEASEGLVLQVKYAIPPVHENLVISATALNPTIDQRNDAVYRNALFARDDQLFDTLAAGILWPGHLQPGRAGLCRGRRRPNSPPRISTRSALPTISGGSR
jgi:hypothetical protein